MHILFFLSNLKSYEDRVRLIYEISKKLDKVTLLTWNENINLNRLKNEKFQIVEVGFKKGLHLYNIRLAAKVADKIIKNDNVHIVHDMGGNLLRLMKKKYYYKNVLWVVSFFILFGHRVKYVDNTIRLQQRLRDLRFYKHYVGMWKERRLCKASDFIVLQAPGLKECLMAYAPNALGKIKTLPNNVETTFWYPNSSEAEMENLLKQKPLKLLYAGGGLSSTKGIYVLLDIISQLVEKDGHGDYLLTLIGRRIDPIDKSRVLQTIKNRNLEKSLNIQGTLTREELRKEFWKNAAMIYQTINDGSPRTVLEAISSGLPVIASKHPGIQVLDPNGKFVAFTDYGDTQQVIEYIRSIKRFPEAWAKRSYNGRKAILKRFSSEAVAEKYLKFYKEIIKTK